MKTKTRTCRSCWSPVDTDEPFCSEACREVGLDLSVPVKDCLPGAVYIKETYDGFRAIKEDVTSDIASMSEDKKRLKETESVAGELAEAIRKIDAGEKVDLQVILARYDKLTNR